MLRVKEQRYLYRRGEQLVFRRIVPPEARHAFDGRGVVQVSLGSVSVAEARHLLARELSKFETTLSAAIGVRSPTEILTPPAKVPTVDEIEEGVRVWYAERSIRVQQEADAQNDDVRASALLADYGAMSGNVADGIKLGGDTSLMTAWAVEALIERFGWALPASNPLHRRLTRLVGRGQVEAAGRFGQELNGEPIKVQDETFSAEQYRLDAERQRDRQAQERQAIPILDLFDGYVLERKPAPATIKAWGRQLAAFIEFLGHSDAGKVSPDDVIAWKGYLLTKAGKDGKGLNAKTVGETYLSALRTTFQWAVDERKLKGNPASGVRVRGPKRVFNRDRGLTNDEAATILRATLLPPPRKLSPERVLARRWIPWICAYTGARVNEITQLRAKDVAQIDGIWAIRITPEAGPVKTSEARTVAMHPHLIEQGFPAVAATASGYLFYDPSRKREGSEGNPQSKKVGEHLAAWVREIGVSDKEVQPNHGWRHRFKTVAKRVGMDTEIRDRIQGHAPRTEGEAYGDVPPDVSFKAINLIPFYGVAEPSGRLSEK